jgi:outer membrane murein-binding lipoprotein Lpp
MSDKPSYLGLLNAISLAESRACAYLTAWIDVTPSPEVRRVLVTVAAREGEHGLAFKKRIVELGYELRPKDDPNQPKRMAIATSKRSDLEKFEKFGLGNLESGELTFLDDIFKDHSIDIQTGALLGRYIAEEHDTGRLLRSCYEQLKAGSNGRASDDSVSSRVATIDAKVDALCAAVEDLRSMVAEPPAAKNGRAKTNGRSRTVATTRRRS